MADIVLNDEEKVELLKKWWKKYGNIISVAAIVVLIAIVGWQYWQKHQRMADAQASNLYEAMMAGVAEQKTDIVQANANTLKTEYKRTIYADLASFFLAQRAVVDGRFDDATQQLQWVIDHGNRRLVVDLARIRLARLLLATGKPDQALDALGSPSQLYPGSYFMAKGQILAALQHDTEAAQAFQAAAKSLPQDSPMQAYIDMLISNLPGANS